eukprot:g9112.t3
MSALHRQSQWQKAADVYCSIALLRLRPETFISHAWPEALQMAMSGGGLDGTAFALLAEGAGLWPRAMGLLQLLSQSGAETSVVTQSSAAWTQNFSPCSLAPVAMKWSVLWRLQLVQQVCAGTGHLKSGVTTPVSAPPTPASPTLGSTQWPTFITASGVDDFNLVSLQSGISQKSAWSLHLNHEIALATAPDVAQKQRNFYTRRPVPLVMRWKRFWAVFALMCAGIGAGIYSISTQYFHALEEARTCPSNELQGSARFAARLVTRDIVLKIRSSMPSLHVLEAAVTQGIDFAKNFEYIADSAVALAPAGTISHVFPHSADLMGKPLLLHPDEAPDALQKAQKRRISVAAKCQAGDGTLVGYLPIRTSDADVFLPSEWFVHQGVNYSRDCSTAALREQHCRLPEEGGSPPPHRRRGRGRPPGPGGSSPGPGGSSSTLVGGFASDKPFWGFALVYSNFKERIIRIRVSTDGPRSAIDVRRGSLLALLETWQDWVLLLAPMNGWQVSFQEFWSHLLLDLCRALLSIFLCIHALAAFCKRAKEIEQLERYRQDSITKAIMASLDALSNFSFPLCLISIEDFKQTLGQIGGDGLFPRLMYYEELRDNGCHQCVDSVEDGMLKYKTEGQMVDASLCCGGTYSR